MNWTDILTYGIVLTAIVFSLAKLYKSLFPKRKIEEGCDSCSTSACGSCGIADLKSEIENKKTNHSSIKI